MPTWDLPRSVKEVWDAVTADLLALSVTNVVNNTSVKVNLLYRFQTTQPELRNKEETRDGSTVTRRFPNVVFKPLAHKHVPQRRMNHILYRTVSRTAQAPYLQTTLATTTSLSDGQTLVLERGYDDGSGTQVIETQTVTFETLDFVNIAAATKAEILAKLQLALTGVTVTLVGSILKIQHDTASGFSTLQVVGGTAAATLAFPEYVVIGRSSGDVGQAINPPTFYDFDFSIRVSSDRYDEHTLALGLFDRLWKVKRMPHEHKITLRGFDYEVVRQPPQDDPMPKEGISSTILKYTFKAVPISWELDDYDLDQYNGGNYDGTGVNPLTEGPTGVEFVVSFQQFE
jgi:hypothetical protein